MKSIFRSNSKFLCVALVLSCLSLMAFGQNLEQKKLIPIQTEPHNNPIEVFYKGEKPTKKYYQIAILEAYRNNDDSYAQIIQDLKIQAQQMGMDAIIITDLQITTKDAVDWEGFRTMFSVKEGVAFGIKYEIDLSYLASIPKVETIYVHNDTSGKYDLAGVFNYDLFNNIESYTCPKSLYDYKYKYSMQHLLHEELNWTTQTTNRGRYKRTYNDGETEKTCWFEFDSLDRVEEVEIIYRIVTGGYATTQTHEMKLKYDEQGRLHQKLIYPNASDKEIFYIETFRYDEFNRLTEKQLFLNFEGDLQPITKSLITEYYSEKELKRLYPELKLRG